MKKPTLIPEWRKAWRFMSVKVSAFGGLACSAFALLPRDDQEKILSLVGLSTPAASAAAIFVLVVVVRLIQQGGSK